MTDLYLRIHINRDQLQKKLWISQKGYILDLLTTYHLLEAALLSLLIAEKIKDLPNPPPNALPEIANEDINLHFQQLVDSILYLSLCTRSDLAFTAMLLGQYNSNPTKNTYWRPRESSVISLEHEII